MEWGHRGEVDNTRHPWLACLSVNPAVAYMFF